MAHHRDGMAVVVTLVGTAATRVVTRPSLVEPAAARNARSDRTKETPRTLGVESL
jgi:hypothetical protein